MKNELSDADFEKMLEEQWHMLNRREKRLAKFNRQALKDAMTKPRYGIMQSLAGTTVTTELRK